MKLKIIHLTRADTFEAIYIAADKIEAFFRDGPYTFVVLHKKRLFSRRLYGYKVLESCGEIKAMLTCGEIGLERKNGNG